MKAGGLGRWGGVGGGGGGWEGHAPPHVLETGLKRTGVHGDGNWEGEGGGVGGDSCGWCDGDDGGVVLGIKPW